ncbi:hypothetical protein LTS18_011106 [Coniosporium uncinatum]|uniref:Uncharacterized protein n=1 Tax=Coniosporium uncinatum TaxID=93489 RepID=A0ACC3DKN4_9PEZI|nr:hypothetical protein LTS18_011106 [Coniosporium uncinatum]
MAFSATQLQSPADGTGISNEAYRFSISLAYSDSTFRTYHYTSTDGSGSWTLLQKGTYLTSCLTQAVHLSNRGNADLLLTGATDGYIALMDLDLASTTNPAVDATKSEKTWLTRSKIHQNSIKALAHTQLSPYVHLVLTGGDDNAIGLTLLALPEEGEQDEKEEAKGRLSISTLLIPRAHAAAVTACAILPPTTSTRAISNESYEVDAHVLHAVTASNDQRVKLWELSVNISKPGVEGVDMRKLRDVSTAVADVSSLALHPLPPQKADTVNKGENDAVGVLVCGVGMELFRLS